MHVRCIEALGELQNRESLPDLSRSTALRRVVIENLKELKNLTALETAPALKEFALLDGRNQTPQLLLTVLKNPALENLSDEKQKSQHPRRILAGRIGGMSQERVQSQSGLVSRSARRLLSPIAIVVAATSAITTARGAAFTFASFVACDCTIANRGLIEPLDRSVSLVRVAHFDESKAA